MNLLLDTHTFIWSILNTPRIPKVALDAIRGPENRVYVSAVSLWEISIKSRLGKIDLIHLTTSDLIPLATKMGMSVIGLDPAEAVSQGSLKEDTHYDPFDRMLIWQAISRGLTLISRDPEFVRFKKDGLRLLWD
ncbi:MAG: type II toxin-antitoxin system VapC family toxin [Acidobacteria bacterium]|nr:type II toxin-antitoxin system VapC family toxin [Acidobacteriota bacterium]